MNSDIKYYSNYAPGKEAGTESDSPIYYFPRKQSMKMWCSTKIQETEDFSPGKMKTAVSGSVSFGYFLEK